MAEDLVVDFGERLRRVRLAGGLRQADVAARAGVSTTLVCRLELGRGGSVPLSTWVAVAGVLGVDLSLNLPVPVVDVTVAQTRRIHRLVVARSLAGGWRPSTAGQALIGTPSRPIAEARGPTTTTLVRLERRECVIVAVWDLVVNVGAAIARLTERAAMERSARGEDWTVRSLVIVQQSGRNRRRLTEEAYAVARAFPAFGAGWLRALDDPRVQVPSADGLVWVDRDATRLRPTLRYLDRRCRSRSRRPRR